MKQGLLLILFIFGLSIFGDNRPGADEFVKEYFSTLKSIPYGESYRYISENYREYTGSIKEYIKWWDSMDMVKIHEVSLVDSGVNIVNPKVRVILGYYFDDRTYYEEIVFVLGYNSKMESWQFLDRTKISQF